MEIQKFKTTEEIRKLYFLQLYNRIQNNDNCGNLKIDLKIIREINTDNLNNNELDRISVNELFKFITYDTRLGEESIYNLENDSANFPEYLYAFNELNTFEGNSEFKHLPTLYDCIIESPDNELVAMYLFHSLYMYNKQGVFLNLVKHPNLYDNGQIRVKFLKNNYLAIEIEDDNNGVYVELYKYFNDMLNVTDASSMELLTELENNSIDWGLNNLSNQLLGEINPILLALNKQNSLNLRRYDISYVSENIRDDYDVAFAAVYAWEMNYKYISHRIQLNIELALKFIQKYPYMYDELPRSIKKDTNFLVKAVEIQSKLIDYLPEDIQSKKEIVLSASKQDLIAFAFNISLAPKHLIEDVSIIKKLVNRNPKVIIQLEPTFKNNEEILSIAIKRDAKIAKLSKEIQSNIDLALRMVDANVEIIQYLDKFKFNKFFALECVKKEGLNLRFFPDKLRSNLELVIEANKQNKNALMYASSILKEKFASLDQQELNTDKNDDLPF